MSDTNTQPNNHKQGDSSQMGHRTTHTVDRDTWLDSRLLKIIGVVYGLGSPLIVWIIVSIYDIKQVNAIASEKQRALEEKVGYVRELNTKIDAVKDIASSIKIDVEKLKMKASIP